MSNTTHDNAMLQQSCRFGESAWFLYWVITLPSSSGNIYVLKEHEHEGKSSLYAKYAIHVPK